MYSDNQLSCIFTPAGRIIPISVNGSVLWKYEYNLSDHLGNVRVVFAAHSHGQPEVMQQTSYYPFGMTLQQQNFGGLNANANKLLYNSKELQGDELAASRLDWYDYGTRFYDAQLGRFHTIDPLADLFSSQSTYVYAANNPIRFIDFLGMCAVGADGLTNAQWMEASKPGADPDLKRSYIGENRAQKHSENQMLSIFSMSPQQLSKRGFSGYYVTNKEGTILRHTIDGMGTFFVRGNAANSGGHGVDDYAALGVGAVGTFNGVMGDAFYSKYHHMQKNGTIRSAKFAKNNPNRIYQTTRDGVKALTKNARILSRGAGIVGSAISVVQFVYEPTYANAFDGAMGATAFIPVVGWAVSGTYFIANTFTTAITGETIGEHIFGDKRVY